MLTRLLGCALLLTSSALFAQEALNNDAVIKLIKAGLSDGLIVSTINASPGKYDTSMDGLLSLKGAGANDKVVAAIILKASGATASAPAPTPANQGAADDGNRVVLAAGGLPRRRGQHWRLLLQ